LEEDDDAGAVVDTVFDVTTPSFLPNEALDDAVEVVLFDVVGVGLVGVPVFVLPARKDIFLCLSGSELLCFRKRITQSNI